MMTPERVKKWGSIGVLFAMGGTLMGTAIVWLFTTATEVKPLLASVERIERSNNEGHKKIAGLIEEQTKIMENNGKRLFRVEIQCDLNREDITRCQEKEK